VEGRGIYLGGGEYDWGKENVFLVREEYVWGRGICLRERNMCGGGEYVWGKGNMFEGEEYVWGRGICVGEGD